MAPVSETLPQRPFGKTGVKVSALGLGGHHLGQAEDEDEALNIVRQAVDGGITFFDNCREYHNGMTDAASLH